MKKDPFKEYIKEKEPDKYSKAYAWKTAIGLQAVDGLKTSDYLLDLAGKNIEGEIGLSEVNNLIENYYKEKSQLEDANRTDEADKVSSRIALILSENSFTFSSTEYISIHRKLFKDIYSHAGKIRDFNVSKKEWVLNGASVIYGSASEIENTLRYDIELEKQFSYKDLDIDNIIKHLAIFISNLWQIHAFEEGNTRTTAVFFIKYLKTLGFDVTNDLFAENSWYFRNALVRANYNDLKNGVFASTQYLELFIRNLLLNESNPLNNRELHI